jgi:hypothetical protein
MVCWGLVGCCVSDAVMRWFLLCVVEGLGHEVNPLLFSCCRVCCQQCVLFHNLGMCRVGMGVGICMFTACVVAYVVCFSASSAFVL